MTDDPTLGDSPITPEHRSQMTAMANAIDEIFNGKKRGNDRAVGFVLMVFPFGQTAPQRCNYISNAARKAVIALLKAQLAYFESLAEPPRSGHAH